MPEELKKIGRESWHREDGGRQGQEDGEEEEVGI